MPVGVHDLIENDMAPAGKLQSVPFKIVLVFFLFVDDHNETVYHQSHKKTRVFFKKDPLSFLTIVPLDRTTHARPLYRRNWLSRREIIERFLQLFPGDLALILPVV